MMTEQRLGELLKPFLTEAGSPLPTGVLPGLMVLLDLLVRWNSRVNLTAVRDPEEIVTRHFGESLFTGFRLPASGTLLDLGSGAGFPGLPIQLLRPDLSVTLAESQGKKAAFLQEAVRTLGLSTKVWARRVEDLPAGEQFDVVTLRAVDAMQEAVIVAAARARSSLCLLAGDQLALSPAMLEQFMWSREPLPLAEHRILLLGKRIDPHSGS